MKNIKIEFSQEQMSVLNEALMNLPYRAAAPLIGHINSEIQKALDVSKDDVMTGSTTPRDQFAGD